LTRIFDPGDARYAYTLWARGQGSTEHAGDPYREFRDLARFCVERSGARLGATFEPTTHSEP
jgi:hypothetical protein